MRVFVESLPKHSSYLNNLRNKNNVYINRKIIKKNNKNHNEIKNKSIKKIIKIKKTKSPAVYTGIKNNSRSEDTNKRHIKIPIKLRENILQITNVICPPLSNQLVRGKQ